MCIYIYKANSIFKLAIMIDIHMVSNLNIKLTIALCHNIYNVVVSLNIGLNIAIEIVNHNTIFDLIL